MKANPWLVRRPGKAPDMRVFCFSYAGGSAVGFMDWQPLVRPGVEICAVQLPGRGARFHEPAYTDLALLVADLAKAIQPLDDLPSAFFGHSLGGLIAFELARHVRERQGAQPQHLFVSGCAAPQFRPRSKRLHELDDEHLLKELHEYNGTPPEVLAQRELMELVLPTVRADFALAENYCYTAGARLSIPMTVFAGMRDDHGTPEEVSGWSVETSGRCDIEWFEGDHFFIHQQRAAVIDSINARLAQMQQRTPLKYA